MRVALIIDHLGPGGAQRQMCMLAIALNHRRINVRLLHYHNDHFFAELLRKNHIPVDRLNARGKIARAWALRKWLRHMAPDIVVAFPVGPSMLAEVAGFPFRDYGLVVSERSSFEADRKHYKSVRIWLHGLADAIVCNSSAQTKKLATSYGSLSARVTTIHNCVDLDHFQPSAVPSDEFGTRVVVCARYAEVKNLPGLIEAMSILNLRCPTHDIEVHWYGNTFQPKNSDRKGSTFYGRMRQEVERRGLENCVHLHPATTDVVTVYKNASVVCLPSFREGLPNTLCEAMACGKPILASRVGDIELLVQDGRNGLLFDPMSPADISEKLETFANTSIEERRQMGLISRHYCEKAFSVHKFVDSYLCLFERILSARRKTQ